MAQPMPSKTTVEVNASSSDAGAMSMDAVRTHASALLSELRAARTASEERLEEIGRSDPMKSVTGKSALDAAIEEIEHIIRAIDDPSRHAESRARLAAALVEPNIRTAAWGTVSATG